MKIVDFVNFVQYSLILVSLLVLIKVAVDFYQTAGNVNKSRVLWAFIGSSIFLVVFVSIDAVFGQLIWSLTSSDYLMAQAISTELSGGPKFDPARGPNFKQHVLFTLLPVVAMLSAAAAAYFVKRNMLVNQPNGEAGKGNDEVLQAINIREDGDASWTHIFYFYGFAFILGGGIAIPVALTAFANIFSTEATELFLQMPYMRKVFFSWLLVGFAFFGFSMELRFAFVRYLIASTLFGLMAMAAAMQSGSAEPVPFGAGLIGLVIVWYLGNLGVWLSNWLAAKGGRGGLFAANSLGAVILVAVVTVAVMNQSKNDLLVVDEAMTAPATVQRQPAAKLQPRQVVPLVSDPEPETMTAPAVVQRQPAAKKKAAAKKAAAKKKDD